MLKALSFTRGGFTVLYVQRLRETITQGANTYTWLFGQTTTNPFIYFLWSICRGPVGSLYKWFGEYINGKRFGVHNILCRVLCGASFTID